MQQVFLKAFKVLKAVARGFAFWFWSRAVGAMLTMNGVRHRGVRAVGRPYINVSLGGRVEIGEGFTLRTGLGCTEIGSVGSRIIVGKGAVLKIGRNVRVSNASIVAEAMVEIGDDVLIGGGAQIFDTNFHPLDPASRLPRRNPKGAAATAPVKIEDGVFIGANAIVCKGVTIGGGSVAAAGAVVVKSIPSGEVWGGNPARFLKKVC